MRSGGPRSAPTRPHTRQGPPLLLQSIGTPCTFRSVADALSLSRALFLSPFLSLARSLSQYTHAYISINLFRYICLSPPPTTLLVSLRRACRVLRSKSPWPVRDLNAQRSTFNHASPRLKSLRPTPTNPNPPTQALNVRLQSKSVEGLGVQVWPRTWRLAQSRSAGFHLAAPSISCVHGYPIMLVYVVYSVTYDSG